ncbi:hypothetical protein ALC62_03826, partial [Cyphomyrmex costatus]
KFLAMFFKRGVKRTHHSSGWCCRQHVPAIFFVFFSIVLFRNWICFHLCTVKTVGYIPNGFWKLDFFARGTDASGALVREKQSVGRARLPSNIPSSVFLLADFCFGGRVTNADIFANSGLGSRLISSSGFFTRALSGVAGLGEAVPNFNNAAVMVNWAWRDEDPAHLVQVALKIAETSEELNQVPKETVGKRGTEV